MTSLHLAAHCRRLAEDADARQMHTLAERYRDKAREFEREAQEADGVRAMWRMAQQITRRNSASH